MDFVKLTVCSVCLVLLLSALALPAEEPAVEPVDALALLAYGNSRFVVGSLGTLISESTLQVRRVVAQGQHPYAVIVSCSDSRVPPEIIFAKGLGEIFVVRVAGNVVAPHQLGSIEYALEHLGARLIVVLGHERCGAVKAAVETYEAPPPQESNLGSILHNIYPAVEEALEEHPEAPLPELVEYSIDKNVALVVDHLVEESELIADMVNSGEVMIFGLRYDLDTWNVTGFE